MRNKILYVILTISILLNIVQVGYSKKEEKNIKSESAESMNYNYYYFMSNPIDNFFKDKFQNHIPAEIARREYQELYLKVWKQEYNTIMGIIKKKCKYEEDITRYKNFTNEISSSFDILKPLLLAEMLENYNYPESPEKHSYGNGTQPMLDMYQGMIYRNACMLFIPCLKDEYDFPSQKELDKEYGGVISEQ